MDKAYFREMKESDQFQLTFQYTNSDLKVDRQFNFCRKLNESAQSLLTRVTTNVEKAVNKKNKKKKGAPDDGQKLYVSLLLNNEPVEMDTICSEIFKPENEVTLNLIDRKYCVLINTPWVENIALPSAILSNFPVYLNKFEAMHTDQDLSSFIWLKSKDKTNWTQVGEGYFYTPTNEDIGHYLKLQCTPKNQTKEGPMVETESTCIVEAGPGICQFETRHAFTTNKLTGKEYANYLNLNNYFNMNVLDLELFLTIFWLICTVTQIILEKLSFLTVHLMHCPLITENNCLEKKLQVIKLL